MNSVDSKVRSFRFERPDQCWPLLFHLEPLLTSFRWQTRFSVTVTDDEGAHEYPDVASAEAAAKEPHRVEMYAVFDERETFKVGLWVVGFLPGQQPAVTIDVEPGLATEGRELRAAITEFLSDGEDTVKPAVTEHSGGWRWVVNQPWTVQVIGGVIATLAAAAILALITVLFD